MEDLQHPPSIAARGGRMLLDGPIGTELNARGVATPLPGWSAAAIDTAPDVLAGIHRDYAAAGATIHTANTFRTKRRNFPSDWKRLTDSAVAIARKSVPKDHFVAGSLSPLEDCYRPDLSPADSRAEHRETAEQLAHAGCDLILCETFPNVSEGLQAVEVAVATGTETWLALTAGPDGNLLSPAEIAEAGKQAVDLGASAVLANCIPARILHRWIDALADAKLSVPFGGYANAGNVDDEVGWNSAPEPAAALYAELAARWIAAGATLIGGCCGTTPAHIEALRRRC